MPPTLPPLQPPGGAAATPTTTTPQQASIPSATMDPVTQQALLAQLQRTGWNAAQPTPEVQYVSNGIGGVSPVVKGYKMVISDPKTGDTKTVDLTYDPTAAGKGSQWGLAGDAGALPKPDKPTAVGSPDTGYYLPDASGVYKLVVPPKTPNADEEMNKALERIDRQQQMTEKQANEAAGRGYMTNAEYATMASKYAGDKLGQDKLAEDIRQFNATQAQKSKEFDLKQAAQDKVDAANILKTGAETGLIGAQTGQVTQATQIAAQKAPAEIEELKARTAQAMAAAGASEAATKKALQDIEQGRVPTTVQATLGTTTPNYAQVDPTTGRVTFQQNQNFLPKTQAEIAARAGQIQSLATQKQAEVQGKVGTNGYTADDALKEFNGWWDQNVAPQQASLQAAQEEAAFQRAKDQAAMRTSAYTTALGAGNQQISGFNAMVGANPVGPGYADVMNQVTQGKMPTGDQLAKAFTYQAPNPMDLAKQGTAEALKYIDPTAAAQAGVPPPNYQAINPAAMLDRTRYMPGPAPGAAPAPGPAAAPPPEPAPAPPPLLPAGQAGVAGVDPRFSGALDPRPDWLKQGLPPPGQPQFIPSTNTWDMAPSYVPGGMNGAIWRAQ